MKKGEKGIDEMFEKYTQSSSFASQNNEWMFSQFFELERW
jgi:hypothetical protein